MPQFPPPPPPSLGIKSISGFRRTLLERLGNGILLYLMWEVTSFPWWSIRLNWIQTIRRWHLNLMTHFDFEAMQGPIINVVNGHYRYFPLNLRESEKYFAFLCFLRFDFASFGLFDLRVRTEVPLWRARN